MADADPAHVQTTEALELQALPSLALDQGYLAEHKIVGLNSRDSRSRAFNLLRTSILKVLDAGEAPHLIGITSATPAAGKSFISANLALSLAKVAEGAVVLVDLDLRRGSIASELGLEPARGIRDFLAGNARLQQVGLRVEGLPLTVLATNPASQESAELLVGARFLDLLRTLRALPAHTMVLFDLPPVFANDDAMLSVKHLDGYILVVDSSETSKGHVKEALAMLSPSPCIGTVLNRYKGGMLDRYGYGYGAGAYGKYYEG